MRTWANSARARSRRQLSIRHRQVRAHVIADAQVRQARTQLLKATIAVVVAWQISHLLFSQGAPFFAALSAFLVVESTMVESVRHGVSQLGGAVAGVSAGAASLFVFGHEHAASALACSVLLAVFVSGLVRLDSPGRYQAVASALGVVTATSTQLSSTIGVRLGESMLGVAVGVAVNWIVATPVAVPQADEGIQSHARGLADLLRNLARAAHTPTHTADPADWLAQARELSAEADQVVETADHAQSSLRWNPRAKQHRVAGTAEAENERLEQAALAVEHATSQVRGIARALADRAEALLDDNDPARVVITISTAEAMAAAAEALDRWADAATGDTRSLHRLAAALENARQQVADSLVETASTAAATDPPAPGSPTDAGTTRAWVVSASVLSDLSRVLDEIDPHGPHAPALRPHAAGV